MPSDGLFAPPSTEGRRVGSEVRPTQQDPRRLRRPPQPKATPPLPRLAIAPRTFVEIREPIHNPQPVPGDLELPRPPPAYLPQHGRPKPVSPSGMDAVTIPRFALMQQKRPPVTPPREQHVGQPCKTYATQVKSYQTEATLPGRPSVLIMPKGRQSVLPKVRKASAKDHESE